MNEAGTPPGIIETVPFSLDDVDYEIDLPADRASCLRELLERYIRAGRRKPGYYFSRKL